MMGRGMDEKGDQGLTTQGEEVANLFKESRSDKQHQCQAHNEWQGITWPGMEWHRKRRKEEEDEEERGCWNGISG